MARLLLALLLLLAPAAAEANEVRVRDLGRFLGQRDNAIVGYGIVTGLAGSGDSPRSEVTRQALRNALSRLGANVSPELLQSRNVAVVIVTATLPATANVGDRLDVNVSSIGDARSLAGGTLLMTPLLGPDQRPYALDRGFSHDGPLPAQCRGLLITLDHPQHERTGPPFSVADAEVHALYDRDWEVARLERRAIPRDHPGFVAGVSRLHTSAYALRRR